AGALDERVGAQRGRVADRLRARQRVLEGLAEHLRDLFEAAQAPDRQIVMRLQPLRGERGAAVDGEAVGEGPADVDVDLHHATAFALSASTSISMSCVSGWPGGRYSTSTCVAQPAHESSTIRRHAGSGAWLGPTPSKCGGWISAGSRWQTSSPCL